MADKVLKSMKVPAYFKEIKKFGKEAKEKLETWGIDFKNEKFLTKEQLDNLTFAGLKELKNLMEIKVNASDLAWAYFKMKEKDVDFKNAFHLRLNDEKDEIEIIESDKDEERKSDTLSKLLREFL